MRVGSSTSHPSVIALGGTATNGHVSWCVRSWKRRPTIAAVFTVTRERFEEFVADALDAIPDEFVAKIENVAFLVEDDAEGQNLFGLYQGTPLTLRRNYGGAMPDRITIFQDAICRACSSEDQVRDLVHETVVHELGHYFGMEDAKLRELGW